MWFDDWKYNFNIFEGRDENIKILVKIKKESNVFGDDNMIFILVEVFMWYIWYVVIRKIL